jgi:hypothetical protein
MSLLAETLVDEWLNRKGFFTVRGIKDGVDEVDLLGVRQIKIGLEGWHVEVQVSFRPVSYITKLTDELAQEYGKKKTSAWERPPDVLKECVQAWVEQKFTCKKKVGTREKSWPGISWQLYLVHGVIKHELELVEIEHLGIKLVPFHRVLADICENVDDGFPGAAGSDLADIVGYYESFKNVPKSKVARA